MTEEKNKYLFQVNLKGMIELLSEHIYSAPNVFVRELLQNGMDAATARKTIDEQHKGEINIYINQVDGLPQVIFEDNGIGLSEKEVHEFLSVIGQSSKRGDFNEKDFIGKFGIGMLSCLVVSHEIIVETRSLIKDESVCWRGKADGTYTVQRIANMEKVGTRVILYPKKEWLPLFEKEELKKNILYFGSALPVTIRLISNNNIEVLVDKDPLWLLSDSTKEELLAYGKEVFNVNFLDVFPLHSIAGAISGVAYIMPYKVQFSGSKQHKVYLKRMYLCEQVNNLLPEWSSFVKCIINTHDLRPTASRESLMDDDTMKQARKELTASFKDYLKVLTLKDTQKLSEIIGIHHVFIKALAVEDRNLLKLFVDYIPFETNKGHIPFVSIKSYNDVIYYTPSLDDFRQIRRIAGSQGKTVINAAYSFEADLIQQIKMSFPAIKIEKITPQDVLNTLEDVVVGENDSFSRFEKRANELLKKQYCKAQLKQFEPVDTPAIYVANDEAMNNKNLQSLSNAGNPFASTLQNFIKQEDNMPTLCFNKDNEIVHNLIAIDDEVLFSSVIHIMYVQALMLGGYPVNKKEMTVFNEALYQLLIMGMSNFIGNMRL